MRPRSLLLYQKNIKLGVSNDKKIDGYFIISLENNALVAKNRKNTWKHIIIKGLLAVISVL